MLEIFDTADIPAQSFEDLHMHIKNADGFILGKLFCILRKNCISLVDFSCFKNIWKFCSNWFFFLVFSITDEFPYRDLQDKDSNRNLGKGKDEKFNFDSM